MPYNLTRTRSLSRDTPILGFTGTDYIRSAVFDATTLTADGSGRFILPLGSILTKPAADPTKVKIFANSGSNVNELQTITITGTPTGGTFTLTYAGQTTAPIAYNATAAQVAAALMLLTNIGQGNLTPGGGALPGTPVTITFINELGNVVQPALTSASSLTGGTTPAIGIVRTTHGSTGEAVFGIWSGPGDKEFWSNASAANEPLAVHCFNTVFDTSKIVNWGEYGELVIQAMPTCMFEGA